MHYVFAAFLAVTMIYGCTGNSNHKAPKQSERVDIAPNVDKFIDGDVTCYLYNGNGISCLRDGK